MIAIGTDTKGLFIYRKNSMRTLTCDAGPNGVNNMYTAQATYGRSGVVTCVQGTVREFSAAGCDEQSMPLPPSDDVSIILVDNSGIGMEETIHIPLRRCHRDRTSVRASVQQCWNTRAMWVVLWMGCIGSPRIASH